MLPDASPQRDAVASPDEGARSAAIEALRSGDLAGAIKAAAALARDKQDPQGLLAVAETLKASGKLNQLIELLHPFADGFSDSVQMQWLLGAAYADTGRAADAIHHLKMVAAHKPAWSRVQHALGYCHAMLGKYGDAIPHLREALKSPTDALNTLVLLSKCLLGTDQVEEAEQCAAQAVELQPDNPGAQLQMGLVKSGYRLRAVGKALKDNDFDAAVAIGRELAAANPPVPQGLLLVDQYLREKRRFAAAIELLAPFEQVFPNDVVFQWTLATGYFNNRERGKAEPVLRRLVALAPDLPQAHFTLGHNLATSARHEEAIPFLETAVRLSPDDLASLRLLADSLTTAGRYAEALEIGRRAAKLDPADAGTRELVAELEQIQKKPPPATAFNRWPKSAQEFGDVRKIIDKYVVKNIPTAGITLRRGMGVFTQGSCFARNLAYSLRRYDLKVDNMTCGEEHNNTFANRAVVDWLRDGVCDERTEIVASNVGGNARERYLDSLRETDLFVYTMGLAAAHFDRETGAFVMSRSTETNKAALFRHCDFRTTSVQDNVDNLLYIMSTIRQLAPRAAMVLTVSPVPLMVATEFHSAIVADCISKSTLRVAVHEVIAGKLPRVIYWPSFEMVRWVGGHTDSMYGADDGSSHHVNLAMIDQIMDSFITVFGDADLRSTLKP